MADNKCYALKTNQGEGNRYLIRVSISYCCCNKLHKFGVSKQQKCTFLEFWRLQVQSQGVSRAALTPEALGESLFLVSSSFW